LESLSMRRHGNAWESRIGHPYALFSFLSVVRRVRGPVPGGFSPPRYSVCRGLSARSGDEPRSPSGIRVCERIPCKFVAVPPSCGGPSEFSARRVPALGARAADRGGRTKVPVRGGNRRLGLCTDVYRGKLYLPVCGDYGCPPFPLARG